MRALIVRDGGGVSGSSHPDWAGGTIDSSRTRMVTIPALIDEVSILLRVVVRLRLAKPVCVSLYLVCAFIVDIYICFTVCM